MLCEEHEKLNEDIKDIKYGIEKIRDNHLRHLNDKLNIILWVVGIAFTAITIISGMIVVVLSR